MRIAIVAPSPVPFSVGGAEKLWWGLQGYINNNTSHQCELFKVRTKENEFWDLIDSYHRFYQIDVSDFDMVISTKYPAWMVQHENHILYLMHHLRGLFDTYHFSNEPLMVPQHLRVGLVRSICELIEGNDVSEEDIKQVFKLLDVLKADRNNYDQNIFKIPGPFIRQIVHFFDRYALHPSRIKKYFAISKNVIQREEYFPSGVQVTPLYPPSKIENFECKDYDYLFTASRLDSPKRIHLMIEAMRYVQYDIKFKIAGIGPEEGRLKELAKGDKRIEFLGYASEEELVDLYSNALAVLYVPHDEDYGLITFEAMRSRKSVITANDSGGTLEFVKNGENGFIVDPDPQSIAEKINFLIKNKNTASDMGDNAYQKVKEISWQNVVSNLIGEKILPAQRKKKILVLSTYSCYPPEGGGQHRLYNLYSLLAKKFDITICSIIESNKPYQNLILNNGLKQICMPQSRSHAEAQWEIEKKIGVNLYDVCMIDFVEMSTDYVRTVEELMDDSDIVIFSHPYLYGLRKYMRNNQIALYEAHNMEYLLKKDYIRDQYYSEKVFHIERDACRESGLTLVTSNDDKTNLIEYYDARSENIIVIPNGVDTSRILEISADERETQKKYTGMPDRPVVLFVGSWHPPNLEALKFIVDNLEKQCRDCIFMVIGSVSDYYYHEFGKLPENILAFGTVSEEEKYELYKLADIAINPMFSGSGTNLKMLDYMSAGIPVISTPIGARGIEIENYKHAIVCPAEQISEKIAEFIMNKSLQEKLRKNGRKLVEERYSWNKIARKLEHALRSMM